MTTYKVPLLNGALTNTRIPFTNPNGELTDSANLVFNGTSILEGGYSLPKIIDSATAFYVSTSGNDTTGDGSSTSPWATISRANTYLDDKKLNANVTIYLGDGTHTLSSTVSFTHPDGDRITITGTNVYSKSSSYLYSSSGSANNYSLVLALPDVDNISVGNYVSITSSSGGTNPTYCCGCHVITAVDTGNKRITVTSKHLLVSSGTVIFTAVIIKTILSCSTTAFSITNNKCLKSLAKLVIVGPSTSSSYGIYANQGARFTVGANVGLCNFNLGIFVNNCASVSAYNYVCLSGCGEGIRLVAASAATITHAVISGCTIRGFLTQENSTLAATYTIITGNVLGGEAVTMGFANVYGGTQTGNTTTFSPTANTLGSSCGFIAN